MLFIKSLVRKNNKALSLASRYLSAEVSEHQKKLMARGLPKLKDLKGVKRVICVASGKGGVGKSTVAVNVAVTLANHFKLKVGLLDADIYGPSVPKMMNIASGHEPELDPTSKLMLPLRNYNVSCMSMGFLVDERAPIVWRGLMVMSAIERLLFRVDWSGHDVLVIDMPPGTGDVQLSVSQNVRVHGAVVVSTPQDVALLDARRGVEMFRKVNVPVLGLVQNMSSYRCAKCGHEEHVFGADGTRRLAVELGCELLGSVPLDASVCARSDSGEPISVVEKDHPVTLAYKEICAKIVASLKL